MARAGSSGLRAGVALAMWASPAAFASPAEATEREAPDGVAPLVERRASGAAAPTPSSPVSPKFGAWTAPTAVAEATREPTLAEVQAAAARLAAGGTEEDASRLRRARAAHWAPVLRAQVGRADTEATRAGTQSQAPLHWDQQGGATTWTVAATWDLGQLIYDRDENALALSSAQLARRRQEVAEQAAQLYAERLRRLQASSDARGARLDTALELLRATAALDALTGGLFSEALASAQAALDQLAQPLHAGARSTSSSPNPSAPNSQEER